MDLFQQLASLRARVLAARVGRRRGGYNTATLRRLLESIVRSFSARATLREVCRVFLGVDPGLCEKPFKEAVSCLVDVLRETFQQASKDPDGIADLVEKFVSSLVLCVDDSSDIF